MFDHLCIVKGDCKAGQMRFNRQLFAICAGSLSLGFVGGYLVKLFRDISLPDVEECCEECDHCECHCCHEHDDDGQEDMFQGMEFDHKIVIGVRTDIKLAASETYSALADAVIKTVVDSLKTNGENVDKWMISGQTKVCTKVQSPEMMDDLIQKAEEAGIQYSVVEHNGHIAACAVGPAENDLVDKVTRHLKLM